MALAIVLYLIWRLSKSVMLMAIIIVGLCLLMAANIEHIHTNNANQLSVRQYCLPGRIYSWSVMTKNIIKHWLLLMFITYASVMAYIYARKLFIGVSFLALLAIIIVPVQYVGYKDSAYIPNWLKHHVFYDNILNARPILLPAGEKIDEARQPFTADMSGKRILMPEDNDTIVIFLVEGLSETDLGPVNTPYMHKLKERSIHGTIMPIRRRTVFYSILCNDYPNMLGGGFKSSLVGKEIPVGNVCRTYCLGKVIIRSSSRRQILNLQVRQIS